MMFKYKHIIIVNALLLLSFFSKAGNFEKTADGIIVYPDYLSGNTISQVQLQVITDNIIRVTALPFKGQIQNNSLIIVQQNKNIPNWNVLSNAQTAILKTKALTAVVNLQSGAVSFLDSNGKKLLNEKPFSRSLLIKEFDGQQAYTIRQTFEATPDDAWYGLGQHQDGLMNYKSYQVLLFQNNTEVAVPFLVSKNNYGILWDNYSITQFGDVRPYQQLNALKLFSANGDQGWLTAVYSNDKNNPDYAVTTRAESSIAMEYLNDSKIILPKEFKPERGIVTWKGSIASDITGIHKLRCTYAGYIKVWFNGKLVLDRWRQAWNPGSAILDLDLQKGEKYTIKIEWIPDGGESYISFKCLPPQSLADRNSFTFQSEAGKQLDYYFITGINMDSVIAGYHQLTGKAAMLPEWAFGKWQSRERYKTEKELLDVVDEFRVRKIPLDNIVQDWSYWKEDQWGSQEFDETRFPSPDSMINVLHKKYNTHFMISVWPKFYEGIDTYKEFDQKGWLYKRNIADRQRDWIAQGYISTFYDAFNEGAQKGFWNLIDKKLYKKGVDAWWMDASEPDILSNVSPEKRKELMTPTALGAAALNLNAYPMENAKGIYQGQRTANPDQRVFILTRSAFAGSQRYAAATWSGDIASRWHDMKTQISAGVNFSMSGIPYWTMDIGGFAVESRFTNPDQKGLEEWRELQTRWYQFGAFLPLFRVHGQFPFREIFNVAPQDHPAYQSMLYYDKLRYRMLPYIYSLAGAAYHNNYTIMRGLVMDFPQDNIADTISDQFLFGPSFLVNPVYSFGARDREVYLPKGNGWYDLYSGKYFNGGNKITTDAPYERMPLFVKEGSIIPFGPELQYTSEKPTDTLQLFVYTGKDASFQLYEDEGTNYNYEKGMYSIIHLVYNEHNKTLTIQNRTGNFPGMLKKRVFKVIWISKDHPEPLNFDMAGMLVPYEGKKQGVKMK